jgi:hypothetical protein
MRNAYWLDLDDMICIICPRNSNLLYIRVICLVSLHRHLAILLTSPFLPERFSAFILILTTDEQTYLDPVEYDLV